MIPYFNHSEVVIGGMHFHAFGFLVAIGVLFGHYVLTTRAKKLGLRPISLVDGFTLVVYLAGFAFGHMLDTLFYHPEVLREHPSELFMFHHGLSSFGGIVGSVVAGTVYIRAFKLPGWVFADLATYTFPFGWLFGRAGCAAVHDHPGRVTDSPLAVAFPDMPPGLGRYDLGLIEFALTPLLVALVVVVSRRSRRPGMIAGALAVAYPIMRFPLDFLRATDLGADSDPRYAGLTPAQWACIGFVGFGVFVLSHARRQPEWPHSPANPYDLVPVAASTGAATPSDGPQDSSSSS